MPKKTKSVIEQIKRIEELKKIHARDLDICGSIRCATCTHKSLTDREHGKRKVLECNKGYQCVYDDRFNGIGWWTYPPTPICLDWESDIKVRNPI